MPKSKAHDEEPQRTDVAVVGDLTDNEEDIFGALLDLEDGSDVRLFINSPGGSAYVALGIVALLNVKRLRPTAIVLGECQSAAVLIFAACTKRLATAHSAFLFHPMRWQTREEALRTEAVSWMEEFKRLELSTDEMMAEMLDVSAEQLQAWNSENRYLTGAELAEYGLCELYEIGRCPAPRKTKPGTRKR